MNIKRFKWTLKDSNEHCLKRIQIKISALCCVININVDINQFSYKHFISAFCCWKLQSCARTATFGHSLHSLLGVHIAQTLHQQIIISIVGIVSMVSISSISIIDTTRIKPVDMKLGNQGWVGRQPQECIPAHQHSE